MFGRSMIKKSVLAKNQRFIATRGEILALLSSDDCMQNLSNFVSVRSVWN